MFTLFIVKLNCDWYDLLEKVLSRSIREPVDALGQNDFSVPVSGPASEIYLSLNGPSEICPSIFVPGRNILFDSCPIRFLVTTHINRLK